MKSKKRAGEFELISRLTSGFADFHETHTRVGDDCAVVANGDSFIVLTTDVMVQDQHFSLAWSSPYQVGVKLMEANVSDVTAMGAIPDWLLLNLVMPEEMEDSIALEIYRGINDRCKKHSVTLVGGDTVRGPVLTVGATLTGHTDKPVLRSGARVGDLVCVTGDVGASAAALKVLQSGRQPDDRSLKRHLEPRCRMDIGPAIARFASAMIDVSDGIGSEVHHICEQSCTGAAIQATALPIHPGTRAAAHAAGVDPLQCALSGGEDFELLFTMCRDDVGKLKKLTLDFAVIGQIVEPEQGIWLVDGTGSSGPLPRGYDHFG